jgi:hypothetical protein
MLAKCIREALLLPCVLCGTNQKIATEPPCHQAHAVCRHDLATACRKAADPATTGVPAFDIFHTVGQVGLPSLLALDLTSYLSNYLTLLWITIYLTISEEWVGGAERGGGEGLQRVEGSGGAGHAIPAGSE